MPVGERIINAAVMRLAAPSSSVVRNTLRQYRDLYGRVRGKPETSQEVGLDAKQEQQSPLSSPPPAATPTTTGDDVYGGGGSSREEVGSSGTMKHDLRTMEETEETEGVVFGVQTQEDISPNDAIARALFKRN